MSNKYIKYSMHKYTEAYIHTHGDNTYILKSYRNITYHHLNTFLKSNINLFRVRTFCEYIFNYSRQCASNHSTRAWITSELLHLGALLWRRDLQLWVHLLARLYKIRLFARHVKYFISVHFVFHLGFTADAARELFWFQTTRMMSGRSCFILYLEKLSMSDSIIRKLKSELNS